MVYHLPDSFSCPTVDFIPCAAGPFDIHDTGAVDVEDESREILPAEFVLGPNYPNPFNSSTRISFSLASAAEVELVVYNITGHKVVSLAGGYFRAGNHAVHWDGRMKTGKDAPSGVYFYRLRAGDFKECRKMLYLK